MDWKGFATEIENAVALFIHHVGRAREHQGLVERGCDLLGMEFAAASREAARQEADNAYHEVTLDRIAKVLQVVRDGAKRIPDQQRRIIAKIESERIARLRDAVSELRNDWHSLLGEPAGLGSGSPFIDCVRAVQEQLGLGQYGTRDLAKPRMRSPRE